MPVPFNSVLQLLTKSSRISQVISLPVLVIACFLNCHLVLLFCTKGRSASTTSWGPGFTEILCELSSGCSVITQCPRSMQELSFILCPLPTAWQRNSVTCVDRLENVKYKKKDKPERHLCSEGCLSKVTASNSTSSFPNQNYWQEQLRANS